MRTILTLSILLIGQLAARAQGFCVAFSSVDIHTYEFAPVDSVCGETTHPIADGTLIEVWWDRDPAGPGTEDTLAPVCMTPPNCPTGTVNFNRFFFNSVDYGADPGCFFSNYFCSIGNFPPPRNFYLRICLNPENQTPHLYFSRTMEFAAGELGDKYLSAADWNCRTSGCCIPLNAPQQVTATRDNCDAVWVTWNNLAEVDSFQIWRDGVPIRMTTAGVCAYEDIVSDIDIPHSYWVVAFNECGAGHPSAPTVGMRASAGARILTPNGGDSWILSRPDTIRWTACGAFDYVRIELNRDFPAGSWELLGDSTVDDGSEVVALNGRPSEHCRMRIAPMGSANLDSSDADFELYGATGFLALARTAAAGTAVTEWDAGMATAPVLSPWYHLKNFGNTIVHVSPPQEPSGAEFARTPGCNTYFSLAPGQMSACSLQLSFDPDSEGIYFDTLRIWSDAMNAVHDTVHIPLAGSQWSSPESPQVVIRAVGNDIWLTWHPVTRTVTGHPITISSYRIYASGISRGPYQYIGSTSTANYIDVNAVLEAGIQFYRVVASTEAAVAPYPLRLDR